MTNFEWIKAMGVGELAKFLCSNMECSKCFASDSCSFGDNGMVKWLKAGGEND